MRIISGKFRGHRLKAFKASHIRPTTDRVKESVFNKLASHLDEARVLDLFAGTGNLSFEAISRGAAEVIAIEKSPKSVQIIKANQAHLKVQTGFRVVKSDVLKFLAQYEGAPFDLIFIDPPFTEKMADKVMLEIRGSSVVGSDSIIMIESTKHETIGDEYGDLQLLDRKDFGDKKVSFFESKKE